MYSLKAIRVIKGQQVYSKSFYVLCIEEKTASIAHSLYCLLDH